MATEPTVVDTVRVGRAMKWAPMLGREVPDERTGVDLYLMSDGSVRWKSLPSPEDPA